MTDEQIIKAVGICRASDTCRGCPYHELYTAGCVCALMKDVFDLIKRQTAEIEGLEETRYELTCIIDEFREERNRLLQKLQQAKSEAIKEFAERLKKRFYLSAGRCVVDVYHISNLVKEMTEVQE